MLSVKIISTDYMDVPSLLLKLWRNVEILSENISSAMAAPNLDIVQKTVDIDTHATRARVNIPLVYTMTTM